MGEQAGTAELSEGWLNSAQAAKYLGISPATVHRRAVAGEIDWRNGGTAGRVRLRFTKADLDAYMRRRPGVATSGAA